MFLFNLMSIVDEYCLLSSEIKWINEIVAANDIFSFLIGDKCAILMKSC